MRRRRFLKTAAVAGLGGLAGCPASDTQSDSPTNAPVSTPTVKSIVETQNGTPPDESAQKETPTPTEAIDLPWIQLPGPPAGPVTDISPSPVDPDYIYTITQTAGLYFTWDGGDTWKQGPPGEHHGVKMQASPHDRNVARSRNVRTIDGGKSWFGEFFKPDKVRIPGFEITIEIDFDPFDENILYAGTIDGFYYTSDNGRTWIHRNIDSPSESTSIPWVEASFEREGLVYAAFPDDAVARSYDRGESWDIVFGPDDPPEADVLRIRGLVLERSGEAAYIAVDGHGIYRIGDGPPQKVAPGFSEPRFLFYDDLTLSADDNRLYFHAYSLKDISYETWEDIQLYVYDRSAGETRPVQMPELPASVTAHPTEPSTLYFGGKAWPWRSEDEGENWTKLNNKFIDQYLIAVEVNPSNPGTVIPGSNCSTGITVSHDYGQTFDWKRSGLEPFHRTWRPDERGQFGEHYVQNIAALGDVAYATTNAGLLISRDNGETWRLLDNEFSGQGSSGEPSTPLSGLAVDPQNPRTVYVGTMLTANGPLKEAIFDGAFIWKSRDGGDSWTEVTSGFPTSDLTIIPDIHVSSHDSELVYLATMEGNRLGYRGEETPDAKGRGLYKSTTGGRRWHRLDTPFSNIYGLSEDASIPGRLYVSTRHELYRYSPERENWSRVLPYDTRAVEAHPEIAGLVFAGARKYDGYWDLLVSQDGGEMWHEGNLTIKMGRGPAERDYDGINWSGRHGEGGDIMDLTVDVSNSTVVAATGGSGLWRGDISQLID